MTMEMDPCARRQSRVEAGHPEGMMKSRLVASPHPDRKAMRIALFNPEFPRRGNGSLSLSDPEEDRIHQPLGLLALATICAKAGHRARVYDLDVCKDPERKFKAALSEFRPDVACFTTYAANEARAMEYARRCGELGLAAVVGGPAATFEWDALLKSPGVAAVICGEGEFPLIALLDFWKSGKEPENVPGLHLRGEKSHLPATRIADLDELPAIDFGLIDMQPYVKREAVGMVTSRGCPYDCFFCSSQKMWERRVAYRSISNVLSELDDIVRRFNYEGKLITFFDDTFTLDRDRTLAFCAALKKRPYTVFWKIMTRVDRVDPELLRVMYESNCRHVAFGIEATTDEDLRRLNKGFSVEQAKKAVYHANRAGLVTEGYFIMGFPWQTRDDLFSTVDAIRGFGLKIPRLSCLTPYAGTHFREKLGAYRMRIPMKGCDRFNGLLPVVETDNFTMHDQAEAMLAFIDLYLLPGDGKNPGNSYREAGKEPVKIAKYDSGEGPVTRAGRVPRISRFIAFREVENGTLAFEYRFGSFALLNRSSAEIIKICRKTTRASTVLERLRRKFGNVGREDVVDAFRLFGNVGFLADG